MEDIGRINLEDIEDRVILLSVAQTYKPYMDENTVYEIAEQAWYLDDQTESKDLAEYALAIYQNEVKGVFSIDKWRKYQFEPHKWEFEGTIAPDNIKNRYLDKKIPNAFGERQYNSSRFLNCNG